MCRGGGHAELGTRGGSFPKGSPHPYGQCLYSVVFQASWLNAPPCARCLVKRYREACRGACQGSGAKPYQTQIDLGVPRSTGHAAAESSLAGTRWRWSFFSLTSVCSSNRANRRRRTDLRVVGFQPGNAVSKAKDKKPEPDISPEVQSWIKNVIVPALVDEFLASHPEIIGLPKREGPEECMDRSWSIGQEDISAVRRLLETTKNNLFVANRIRRNVTGPVPEFSKDEFWRVLMGCLLTTQQRAGPKSVVGRFMLLKPFPLTLAALRNGRVSGAVFRALTSNGGIRRTKTIANRLKPTLNGSSPGDGGSRSLSSATSSCSEAALPRKTTRAWRGTRRISLRTISMASVRSSHGTSGSGSD